MCHVCTRGRTRVIRDSYPFFFLYSSFYLLHFVCTRRWGWGSKPFDLNCISVLLRYINIHEITDKGYLCFDIILTKSSFRCYHKFPKMFHRFLQEFQQDLDIARTLVDYGHTLQNCKPGYHHHQQSHLIFSNRKFYILLYII